MSITIAATSEMAEMILPVHHIFLNSLMQNRVVVGKFSRNYCIQEFE